MRRILILILVLSTLLSATAPAARADDPVQRAIVWLHTQQLADGSFGNRPGAAPASRPTWFMCWRWRARIPAGRHGPREARARWMR